MRLFGSFMNNRKGAGTLMYFVVLLPIIFLIGGIIIDLSAYMMIRADLQNVLDTSMVSAINLSMKDNYRSDKELTIFRYEYDDEGKIIPNDEKFTDDFLFLAQNFQDMLALNLGDQFQVNPVSGGDSLKMSMRAMPKGGSEAAKSIKDIDIQMEMAEDPFDAETLIGGSERSLSIRTSQKANIKMPMMSNMMRLIGIRLEDGSSDFTVPVTLTNRVGNIRVGD